MRISMELHRLRLLRGFSQSDIAHAVGIEAANLCRIEKGKSDPHWSMVVRILSALGYDIEIVPVLGKDRS